MSAVMKDAVSVCRVLLVRYLWVDALCIIQHAHFTICAMSSPSCHQGFLGRRQVTLDVAFRSTLYPPVQGTYTLILTGLHKKVEYPFDPHSIELRNSPWNKRGWVFQEQALSTRKLFFGGRIVPL
ncbi:hypothetical protein N658DRAFT_524161 [Parathielavia hyrcaniae]|uniref:Heterokaryon incompatibility domain-containing protein n=1 Tax=Parathielavia hyrcaniae TaxID=113614 RepID=A0AAN6Q4R0_9PEZI|nr:hypothetical protein N658DRAFT_524161 [Parathielavia hyrcaniae]